jgi:gas vesicle protein
MTRGQLATTASPRYSNTAKVHRNCPKSNLNKIIEALKEEMSRSLKEIQENINKQVKEINKTVQDLKMKIEAIKKTQTERILEMDNVGK